jgi:hypothetical protein
VNDDRCLVLLLDLMVIFTCWCAQILSSSACDGDAGGGGGATRLTPHPVGGVEQQGGRHRHVRGWAHDHRVCPNLQLQSRHQLQPDVGGMSDPSFIVEGSEDTGGDASGGTCT